MKSPPPAWSATSTRRAQVAATVSASPPGDSTAGQRRASYTTVSAPAGRATVPVAKRMPAHSRSPISHPTSPAYAPA